MDRYISQLTSMIARYQGLIALVCLVVLAAEYIPGFDLPLPVFTLLVATAGILGVARPTETAAKIAGEVASARGGVKIAALLAALAGAFAVNEPETVEHDDELIDVVIVHEVDSTTGEVVDNGSTTEVAP